MPIHSCTLPEGGSGYKWGNHGKCFADRTQAEAQAAAAYAHGYSEKGWVVVTELELSVDGQYRLGFAKKDMVELFVKYNEREERYLMIPEQDEKGECRWRLIRPEDQRAFTSQNKFAQVVHYLAEQGHDFIIWPNNQGGAPVVVPIKAAVERIEKRYEVPIIKVDQERRLVYGVVLEPDTLDSQDDVVSATTIEQTAHKFMEKSRVIGLQHSEPAEAVPVESYIAPVDFDIGGEKVKKGSWVMVTRVDDPDAWAAVKAGDITGYSIGGYGVREEKSKAPTIIQTLLFDKDKFSKDGAVQWAENHDFSYGSVDETETAFRLQQKDPGSFAQDSMKTIRVTEGVSAVVGHLRS